jgi:hypothetical protein|tara:strand:+ start:5014 stop:5343 length:330 start_codon:yes stop_codon:yes gene_type:complete
MANKRQVVFEFRDILYDNLIPRFGENFALKDVLYQLAAMGLIPPKTLRNYMMIHDFDKFIIQNKGHVGHTFIDISVKYDISEKQAKNIVYKQRSKFNANSNIRQDSSLR